MASGASTPDVRQNFDGITASNNSRVFAGYTDNSVSVVVNVNGTPLEQASVKEVSVSVVKTAIQLATGAYGWFKATERSQSLTQILSADGAELKSTSSFNLKRYVECREEHNAMQGVIIEGGATKAISMPKASTAVSATPGMSCLRAITACLLCLCSKDSIIAILGQLIPFGLVQHTMDDGKLQFEGPLLASLKQWVTTVALEEESNKFKDHLLEEASQALRQLQPGAGLDEIMRATHHFETGDENLILGVLKWAITPEHRRQTTKYPTRSLRAWTAASILSQLGFTICAANYIVNDHEEYKKRMSGDVDGDTAYDVFLAVSHHIYGETDVLSEIVFAPDEVPLPRAMLLQDIPFFAFKHVRHLGPPLDDDYLRRAYNFAFERAASSFEEIHVENFQVKLQVKKETEIPSPFQDSVSALFNPFSPHIYVICSLPFEKYVGSWQGLTSEEWDFSNYEELFECIRIDSHNPTLRNFYTTVAIVLGAIYGICSCACRDQGSRLQGDSEIAFSPDNLYEGSCKVLRRWATSVGRALHGTLGYHEWVALLFEMFVGATDRMDQERDTAHQERDVVGRKGYIFGIQSHGFTAVSDVLVRLQIRPESLGFFHITRGQLLNLPCDNQGFVRGSTFLPHAVQIRVGNDEQDNVECLYRSSEEFPTESTRFDIEPCWDDNSPTVILRMRQMGLALASLNIGRVLERLSRCVATCSCGNRRNEAKVPVTEKWYRLLIRDLKSYSFDGLRPGQLANLRREDKNFLIDASQSVEALVYVLGIIDAHRIIIARDCLECAYKAYTQKRTNERVVIVIPHGNTLVKDTEDQIAERARVIEKRMEAIEAQKRAFRTRLRQQVK
ncbi:hypothetical protein DL771_012147 [Monosporascus sp. 5C6A]|nr:hypothetical protein DL771_012147 [Monosporascus sp. 5C6A]